MSKRKYKVKDVVMLTTAATIAGHFEANRDVFLKDNPHWDDQWLADFQGNITGVSEKVGVKSYRQHKEATALMNLYQSSFKEDLSVVKTQIERGYRDDPGRCKEMLSMLGYSSNRTKAGNGNQNAMLTLLYTFDNHTDEKIYAELSEKKVSTERIDSLKAGATKMHKANVTQEILKGTAPAVTAEILSALNGIYNTAMDICKMGKIHFSKDKIKRDLFNFSKIASQQG